MHVGVLRSAGALLLHSQSVDGGWRVLRGASRVDPCLLRVTASALACARGGVQVGDTPLHLAARYKHTAVQALLDSRWPQWWWRQWWR